MDWAGGAGAALIPFGGGSERGRRRRAAQRRRRRRPAVTLDLRATRPGAGDRPRLARRAHPGRRVRPGAGGAAQAARRSRCGISRRASSTRPWAAGSRRARAGISPRLYTHIDDFVESLRVVTPAGALETRRLPGSGAGPSPDRLFIGSEGILGVITEAWMRAAGPPALPRRRRGALRDFFTAARAVRAHRARPGLYPANCRILDPQEAYNTGAGDGSAAIMVLAFESADHPLDAWMARALECCADHGGAPGGRAGRTDAHREGAAGLGATLSSACPMRASSMAPRGDHHRHVRDRDHLGPVRSLPRPRSRRRPSERSATRPAGPDR